MMHTQMILLRTCTDACDVEKFQANDESTVDFPFPDTAVFHSATIFLLALIAKFISRVCMHQHK